MSATFPHPLDGAPPPEPPEAARNVGHGHVFARPDGHRSRCGGPALCRECQADQGKMDTARADVADSLALLDGWAGPFLRWARDGGVLDLQGLETPVRVLDLLSSDRVGAEDARVRVKVTRALVEGDGPLTRAMLREALGP